MADLFTPDASNAESVLAGLRAEAATCTLCPLYEPANQTVFGEGRAAAQMMLVGEQPGDQEDIAGEPFVGPAGQMLDECLDRAGIDRSSVYVTNSVKHFKFVPRGRRRIHEKPKVSEIDLCATAWLHREVEVVAPDLIVALGASAVRGVTGRSGTIKSMRSDIQEVPLGKGGERTVRMLVTVHPSYLLRIDDPSAKQAETEAFVDDLRMGREYVAGLG
jgi:DNA polymerase